jgi:O-antigen/teichoic acid export membrane protein
MNGSLRRVFGNAGWFLSSRSVTGVLSLFYLALAARVLGLTGFGQFALVTGLAQAITGFVTFQTWQIVIRFGMPHLQADDDRGLDAVIGFSIILDVASALAGSLITIAAVLLLAPVFGWSPTMAWQAASFCAVMLLSLRSTPIGILRLHDRFALAAVGDTVTPVIRLLGAGAAALLAPDVTGFLIAWGCAEAATAIAFWCLALSRHPIKWRARAICNVIADNPGLWRFAWFTNAASSLSLSTRQITILLVGSVGGAAAAGAFRIAAQLAQAITKLTLALSRSVFPELVRVSADRHFRRLIIRMTGIAMLTGLIALTALATIGGPLLHFLAGRELAMAYWPMILLTASAALDLGGVSLEPALTALGRAGLALILRAFATALQFGLLLLLLPSFGALGAGWASIAGSAAALLLTGIAAWRLLRPVSAAAISSRGKPSRHASDYSGRYPARRR